MTERIKKLAKEALEIRHPHIEDDTFFAVYAGYIQNSNEPMLAMRQAFAELVSLPEDDLIVGNYVSSRFMMPREVSFTHIRTVYQKYIAYYKHLHMNGGNHKSADFSYVINNGIAGMLRRIGDAKDKYADDVKKISYLDDLEYAANAVIALAEGSADAVHAQAVSCNEVKRRAELYEIEAICRRVPKYPAQSFREAVQSFFFVYTLFPDGVGCLDRYLFPYYRKDIEAGVITHDEALELVENLFVNIFGTEGAEHEWSGITHGVLAGYGEDGECQHSEMTDIILEATCELPLWRPQFSYRVTKKTTKEQFSRAVEAHCKRPDIILFLNDDVLVGNLIRLGVSYADAVGYSVSGCNELILTGCSQMGSIQGHINLAHSLTRLLSDKARLEKISDFEALYAAYEDELKKDINIIVAMSVERDTVASEDPAIAESLFTDGCIEKGISITKGGARYNHCTWCLSAIVNAADSLAVLRKTVFEGTHTLAEWSDCLAADWNGYDGLRREALDCTHFGNADPTVDTLVNRIAASLEKITADKIPFRGGKYLFGTLTGYEIAHVMFGQNTTATPDGRHCGDAFAASVSAFPSTEKSGISGYLTSAASIDGRYLQTSVVVNLTLEKSFTDTPEKRERLGALLRTYFNMGGVQLQINYLGADELICAQNEPEKYRNLRVRVTGFSGFFTQFDKALQDEIISRRTHTG